MKVLKDTMFYKNYISPNKQGPFPLSINRVSIKYSVNNSGNTSIECNYGCDGGGSTNKLDMNYSVNNAGTSSLDGYYGFSGGCTK